MRAYLIEGSKECSNPNGQYNVVVKRGPVVFARDYRIEGEDMFKPINFMQKDRYLDYTLCDNINFIHQVGITIKTLEGYITLADYGSCGKTESDESTMCLWIPTTDYYSKDLTKKVIAKSYSLDSVNKFEENKYIIEDSVIDFSSEKIFDTFAWKLEAVSGKENCYRIYLLSTNDYLTIDENGINLKHQKEKTSNGSQYFYIDMVGLNRFKIRNENGKLITIHGETKEVYMLNDIGHELQ